MTNANTSAKVFEKVLSIPGMNDNVKIQLSITRKIALLLSKVIERGINDKNNAEENNILDIMPKKQCRN